MGADSGTTTMQDELERLIALEREIAQRGTGEVVFLAGAPGSGRAALADAFAERLAAERPEVALLAGRLRDGLWEPAAPQDDGRLYAAVEGLLDLAAPCQPLAALAAQIAAASPRVVELLAEVQRGGRREDPFRLIPRMLQALAQERPTVLLAHDADEAGDGWWADLATAFAEEVAAELPLLLCLTLDGPVELGAHAPEESPALFAARRLVAQGAGSWRPLGAAQDGPPAALPPLGERLRAAAGDDSGAARARELLAWGALEGPRFTADAIAAAAGWDRDETIDLLDDRLSGDGDGGGPALVAEVGAVAVEDAAGERHLWRYAFAAAEDRGELLRDGFPAQERAGRSLALAQALEERYGPAAHPVAPALARLFADGGDAQRAVRWARWADVGGRRDLIHWRARRVREAEEPQEPRARERAAVLLIAAAEAQAQAQTQGGPSEEALACAQAAADLAASRLERGHALQLAGSLQLQRGEAAEARATLVEAVGCWREEGEQRGEASARYLLAMADRAQGEADRSRVELENAVNLYRVAGDVVNEGAARHALGTAELERGRPERARAQFTRVRQVYGELGEAQAELVAHNFVAFCLLHEGDLERARAEYRLLRERARAAGAAELEPLCAHQLALIDVQEGRFDAARAGGEEALAAWQALGDEEHAAAARQLLEQVDRDRPA
jgi:tetratricopeptide (TPR) repeat protein